MDPLHLMSADKTGDQELFRTLSSDAQPKALLAPPFVLLGSRLSSLLQPLPDAPLKALLAPPASARYFSDAQLGRSAQGSPRSSSLCSILSEAQLGRSAQGSPRSSSLCSIFFGRSARTLSSRLTSLLQPLLDIFSPDISRILSPRSLSWFFETWTRCSR